MTLAFPLVKLPLPNLLRFCVVLLLLSLLERRRILNIFDGPEFAVKESLTDEVTLGWPFGILGSLFSFNNNRSLLLLLSRRRCAASTPDKVAVFFPPESTSMTPSSLPTSSSSSSAEDFPFVFLPLGRPSFHHPIRSLGVVLASSSASEDCINESAAFEGWRRSCFLVGVIRS